MNNKHGAIVQTVQRSHFSQRFSLLTWLACFALLFITPSFANLANGDSDEGKVVSTPNCKVRGYIHNGALEFRGIPHSMPILDDNR